MLDFQIDIYNDLSYAQVDLINAFNENNVQFIIIGGYAMIFHGSKRNTADLDLLVSYDEINIENIINSFKRLRTKTVVVEEHLKGPQKKLRWHDVEIITLGGNLDFDIFYSRAIKTEFNGMKFFFPSIEDCIKIKEISDRNKNKADLDFLKSIMG